MTIPVTISAKGMTVNERLQAHIEKKVGKLDRYLPELRAAQLDLVVNKAARNSGDRKVAQITLQVPRTILRAEEHSADFLPRWIKQLKRSTARSSAIKEDRYTAGTWSPARSV